MASYLGYGEKYFRDDVGKSAQFLEDRERFYGGEISEGRDYAPSP